MARNRSALVKEFSKKDSDIKVQDLIKKRVRLSSKHFVPGNIVFTSYNAKFKDAMYDKTPLVLIPKRGRSHTLGLNFHWLPLNMRLKLIKTIIRMNKKNIEKNKPLEFSYEDLKPMLKGLGYAPCIRKYINPRFGRIGVPITPDRLVEVARLKSESFTGGKYSAERLYKMAKNKYK